MKFQCEQLLVYDGGPGFSLTLSQLNFAWLQYDAFDIGFITTDDFTNADILEATYPAVAKRLQGDWIDDPAIPIVTGFLGKVCIFPLLMFKAIAPILLHLWCCTWIRFVIFVFMIMHIKLQGWKSCAVTTLGRGGSDLTATTIGKALGLREIQVCVPKFVIITCWKSTCSQNSFNTFKLLCVNTFS